MSDRDEQYRQIYLEALQPKVPSPIRQVGVFSRPGSMASVALSKVWEREGVVATVTGESAVAKHIQFQLGDGDAIELDSNQMPGFASDFNLPIVHALSTSQA